MRIAALLLSLVAFACGSRAPALPPDQAIVILISIDGWRWDYLDRFNPPVLSKMAAAGVRADGLIPQFPSKTFPNHYTVVTGLRVGNHGIVSNTMLDPVIPGRFSLSNREVQADTRWWGGEPIWNTVESQGRVAAAMFWPGSETPVGGGQATYWMPFDNDMPNGDRVNKILEWLRLPDGKRPSFLTLYFSDVDNAGHNFGPDAAEVRAAALAIDQQVGDLVAGVRQIGLADRVHYVVISDHGMSAVSPDRVILLDNYLDVEAHEVVDMGPLLSLAPKDGDVEKLYRSIKDKHPHLHVYRNTELPAEYHLAGHPRIPPVVGVVDEGWLVSSERLVTRWQEPGRGPPGGEHAYDPRTSPSMQGLFIAQGPRLASGLRVQPFENIHLYEFMCAVLGLTPAKNDGDPAVTRDMLRNP